ncbi:hypothetical protein AAFC00_000049 [Neodothiora populina]|uniref:Sorting nexin MVP1 n=1 Tax=Neodothiora populina TaxID=2781224 RepID=A0ABR3P2K7_9PEZI
MSLFGTSPPSVQQASKSSLFDDEPGAKSSGSGGLFDDDDDTAAGGSPWDFPNPKKNSARRNVIKTLLPATDVPEAYIDAFDVLSAETGGVEPEQIRSLLVDGRLGAAEQAKIIDMIGGSAEVLGRPELNVLLALIGLAQEGEDLSLDAVDERKSKLPIPSLPSFKPPPRPQPPQQPPQQQHQQQHQQQQQAPPDQQQPPLATPGRPPQPSTGPNQTGTMRSAGWDSDPWGSPDMHKGHDHAAAAAQNGTSSFANGSNGPSVNQRTTSNFTTHSEQPDTSRSAVFEATRPPTSESGWGTFSAPAGVGFGGPSSGDDDGGVAGGFGDPGGNAPDDLARQLRTNKALGGVEELVTVNVLEEKEGMFMFQHRNYEVASVRRGSKVIRRYSDFVWLLDCLHKRYPFRQLPLLPPKRVAINGKHIAADTTFIEKRRRGLARFANALVRHPVLREEQLVIMFLTVPTELAVWRKQATISVQEEFTGKSLPPGLEDSLPPTLPDLFEQVRSGVRRSTEIYINLCNMMERLTKHNYGLSAEYSRVTLSLQSLTECSADTYAIDTNEIPLLNAGLSATAKHLSTNQSLLDDEARAWDLGVLEDLKRQRDALVSMRDMFDRRDKYSKDNIPQLERRIASNENKLAGIRAKPEHLVKPGEAEKVESAIIKDKQSIVDQHARGVFIRECVRDEIMHFQNSQYHISRTHQEWSQERVKYAELGAENWRALGEELDAMPLGD